MQRFTRSERKPKSTFDSLLEQAEQSTPENAAEINEAAGQARNAKMITDAQYYQIHTLLNRER